MSREAMKWSYGEDVLKLKLKGSALALLRALKMPHDLSDYYGALNRCRQTSRKGRRIGNRLAYLLKALRQNLSQASA